MESINQSLSDSDTVETRRESTTLRAMQLRRMRKTNGFIHSKENDKMHILNCLSIYEIHTRRVCAMIMSCHVS